MMQQSKRVYIWELPVRLTHWINTVCIVAFSITGLYIGDPFMHALSADQYIMGWMRFIHFIAGYAFLMSMIIRIYWSFMGNEYANWRVLFPFSAERWSDLIGGLKFYALLSKKAPFAIGHTATAGLTYLIVFLIFGFEIVSGFALYSVNHSGLLWTLLGGWLTGLLHLQTIRLYHHLAMYVILAFVLVHIYIAWWLDSVEKNGLMFSIFGGYKFISGKE